MTKKFTVAVQYLVPVWRAVAVEADDITGACAAAIAEADADPNFWESAPTDWDSCGPTKVAALVEGEVENPYNDMSAHLRVPSLFAAPDLEAA